MNKVYIAGCGGMLGEAFHKQFNGEFDIKCTDIDVNTDWLSYCDIRDYEAYLKDVASFDADVLIHLGAYTDLEYCEHHVEGTYLTNTISVENACYIANQLGIPLVYISTAGIFDGTKELYDDWDLPNPICHYARSKYMGELFVEKHVTEHLVLRAGWMMGGGPQKDKKFIQKIIRQLKDGKKELSVVDDKLGTPTYTQDFAQNTILLLKKRFWGVYNMVCDGVTGRLEVAQEILRLLGMENDVRINVVNSDFFKKEYFVRRPASERLICSKLKLRNVYTMRHWKDALEEYLNEYYSEYISG